MSVTSKSKEFGNDNKAYDLSGDEKLGKDDPPLYAPADELDSSDVVKERGTWSNQREFLLSCIAMSVGLGNVWRFPVTAYANGGGAFLIPYFIVLIFIGRPIYFLELCIGQFTSYTQIKAWKSAPLMKGVGWMSMVAMMAVLTYYCSIMGLTVFYFIASFSKDLPWTKCNEDWGDDVMCELNEKNETVAKVLKNGTWEITAKAELYYLRDVLHQYDTFDDGVGKPDWKLTLCLLFSWATVFLSLIKGVKSSGKVAYFTALFPYVVLLILLIRGVTLPGAGKGIEYFVKPQWDKLKEPTVWYAAVSQCFFSLNTGFGSLIMFASYNPFHHNIYRDSMIVSVADTGTSLIAGFTIFSVLGNLAEESGSDIESVVRGGNGLAFISYPEALAKFPAVPQLFAVLFFLMLFTLGLGSVTSDTGAVVSIFCDLFPKWKRWIINLAVCSAGFLFGLLYVTPTGQYILDLVDFYGGTFIIYTASLLEVIAIAWVYGLFNFITDVEFMLNMKVGIYWKICWGFIIPVGLTIILIYALIKESTILYGDDQVFPVGATACGVILAAVSVAAMPLAAIHTIRKLPGTLSEKLVQSIRPSKGWGPRNPIKFKEWEDFKIRTPTVTFRQMIRTVFK